MTECDSHAQDADRAVHPFVELFGPELHLRRFERIFRSQLRGRELR